MNEVTHLGLPDGGISEHETWLADQLSKTLGKQPKGAWCAANWWGDGHPDHEAVGRASLVAARRTGAVLLEYPIWMWHWAVPDDAAVPWSRARSVALARSTVERKKNLLRKAFAVSSRRPPASAHRFSRRSS